MNGVLSEFVKISALVFVLSSMLAMGLSLTIPQILEPLKNVRLVIVALLANFVAVPLLAWGVGSVLNLDTDLYTGLILVATAAGAPFLPKLAQTAKGNIPLSVGIMVLLMVVTVVYLPLVLPLFLSGVEVSADGLQPHMAQASSIAILFMLVGGIVLSWSSMVALVGTGGLLAAVLFLVGALLIGLLAGSAVPGARSVLGLGTAQRNLSAALVVGALNFSGESLTFVIVIAMIGLAFLLPLAAEMGKRATATAARPSS